MSRHRGIRSDSMNSHLLARLKSQNGTSRCAKLSLWASLVVLTQISAGLVWSQSTFGSFVGTVHDPSGAVVASCTVTAQNTGTSATRTTTTDQNGTYGFVNLEPGSYQITMEAPGFQRASFPNLVLTARQTV